MLTTDNINYIELSLLESDVDIILDALQLYAFNFHRVWAVDYDSDLEQLRNSLIFHLYHSILSKYSKSKYSHKEYDLLDSCRLYDRRQKVKEFKMKKFA